MHFLIIELNRDNIRYDLLRTGNVELTSNKILEKGFLPAVCSMAASPRLFHSLTH